MQNLIPQLETKFKVCISVSGDVIQPSTNTGKLSFLLLGMKKERAYLILFRAILRQMHFGEKRKGGIMSNCCVARGGNLGSANSGRKEEEIGGICGLNIGGNRRHWRVE